MRYRLFPLIAFLLPALSVNTYASPQPEFRAVEVQTWVPVIMSQQEIGNTVKWAKGANLNIVNLQAGTVGGMYFQS